MAEREVKLTFRVEDAGGIAVLDEAGRKVGALGEQSKKAGDQVTSSWTAASIATTAVTAAFTALAAAATAGAAAFGFAMNELRKVGDLRETAQTMGLTVEQLSALSVTATMAGTTAQSLGTGLAYLSRQIVAQNPYFAQLGVAIKDNAGEFRTAIDVAKDLQRVFSDAADGPEKLAAGFELLGRNREWLRVLNEGSGELAKQEQLAHRLGLVFVEDLAKRSDDVFDSLSVLGASVRALGVDIGSALLPDIEAATAAMLDWWQANRDWIKENIVGTVQAIRDGFYATAEAITAAANALKGFGDIYRDINATGLTRTPGGAVSALLQRGIDWWEGIPAGTSREEWDALREKSADINTIFSGAGVEGVITANAPPRLPRLPAPASPTGAGGSRAAAVAREDRSEVEALNDALEARLSLLDADADRRQLAVDLAKEDLQLAEQFGATDAERIARMVQITGLEQRALEAKRTALEAERDAYGELGVLTAKQVADAAAVQVEIEQIDGQLARLPDKMAAFAAQIARSREVVVDLSQTFGDSMRRAVDGLLASGGSFKIESVAKDTGRVIASELVGGFLKAQMAKTEFDEVMIGNFGVTLPKAIADGARSIWETLTGLFDRLTGGAQQTTAAMTTGFTGAFGQIASSGQQFTQVMGGLGLPVEAAGAQAGPWASGYVFPGGTAAPTWGQGLGAGAAGGMLGISAGSLMFGNGPAVQLGGLGGAAAGGLGGFLLGSAIPIIGPLLGAFGGALLGGIGGSGIGSLFAGVPTYEHKLSDQLDNAMAQLGFARPGNLANLLTTRAPGWLFTDSANTSSAAWARQAIGNGVATFVDPVTGQPISIGAPGTAAGVYGGPAAGGALALGAIYGQQSQTGAAGAYGFAYNVIGTAGAMGWTAEETDRQLKTLAESMGGTLPDAIKNLNMMLDQGQLTAYRYTEAISAAIDIMGPEMTQKVTDAAIAMATVWDGVRTKLDPTLFAQAAEGLMSLETAATDLRDTVAATRRGQLRAPAHLAAVRDLMAGTETELAQLRGGGITGDELERWQELVAQQQRYAEEGLSVAQSLTGARGKQAVEEFLQALETVATLYEEPATTAWAPGLGLDQPGVQAAITEAYGPLNTSIDELDKALDRQTFYLERWLNDREHWSARDERIYANLETKIDQLRDSIDDAAAAIPAAVDRWAEAFDITSPAERLPGLDATRTNNMYIRLATDAFKQIGDALREHTVGFAQPVQVHINVDGAQLSGDGRTLADFIGKATVDAMRNDLRVRAEVKRIAVSKS